MDNIKTVRMKINDEVGDELQQMVDEGSNTKDKGTLPQKATSMRFYIVIASGRFHQNTYEVNQE